jgi:flagellar biosynthesis GTPase FlhF
MKSQQGVTQADAQLFFRAACCLISADGNIRSKEVAALSEAMNRLGFLHTPEQLRTLAVSTCKEIHAKGVDGESTALASQLSRLRATPLASYLQQTLLSLAASDGGVTEKEQRIASRLCDALVSSTPSGPPQLAASLQAKSVGPPPIGAKSRPQHQPKTAGSWHPLDWKWIFPILLVFFAVVRVRMAFLPAANDAKGRPNQPRATEARATDARATEARATEARATEARATEARATEARAAEARAAEARAAEARAAEARAAEESRRKAAESESWKTEPKADLVINDIEALLEFYERANTDPQVKQRFLGKVVRVEKCWFDPTSGYDTLRNEAEGVYAMLFGFGDVYESRERIGNQFNMYLADNSVSFYCEDARWMREQKDWWAQSKRTTQEKLGYAESENLWQTFERCQLYFVVLERPRRKDGLRRVCAKLIHVKRGSTP